MKGVLQVAMSEHERKQALKETRKERLESVVWKLRLALGRWEKKDKVTANQITEAIGRANAKRSKLGYIGNRYYEPAWLSAHSM